MGGGPMGGGPGLKAEVWAASAGHTADTGRTPGLPQPGVGLPWTSTFHRSELAIWTPPLLEAIPEFSELPLLVLFLLHPFPSISYRSPACSPFTCLPGPSSPLLLTNLCVFKHTCLGFRCGVGNFPVWMIKVTFAHRPLGEITGEDAQETAWHRGGPLWVLWFPSPCSRFALKLSPLSTPAQRGTPPLGSCLKGFSCRAAQAPWAFVWGGVLDVCLGGYSRRG